MLLTEDNSHQEQQSGSFSAKIESGPFFREVRSAQAMWHHQEMHKLEAVF